MRIVDVLSLGKVKALFLENEAPSTAWSNVRINGAVYRPVPVYDLPKCIAIEADGEFAGKIVEFI